MTIHNCNITTSNYRILKSSSDSNVIKSFDIMIIDRLNNTKICLGTIESTSNYFSINIKGKIKKYKTYIGIVDFLLKQNNILIGKNITFI